MAEKISITRGLSEIKLLEKKINKKVQEFTPCAVTTGKKPPVGYETVSAFKESEKSKYQSILDLIKRRSEIKRKIVLSNATTKVTVADTEMTIAEAIDYKTSVVNFKKILEQQIDQQYNVHATSFQQSEQRVMQQVDRQLEVMYGRDKKVTQDERDGVVNPYLENNGPKFIDSIDCKKESEGLTEEVNNFLLEVDHTLSESNATTFIEIG